MYHENATADALMKRGYLYLEDHDWENAKTCFHNSLDDEPENAQAYIGILLSELHIEREKDISQSPSSFADNYYYQKALRFAKGEYKQIVENYNLENIIYRGELLALNSKTEEEFLRAAQIFEGAGNYKKASEQAKTMRQRAAEAKLETTYQNALSLLSGNCSGDAIKAKALFETISEYKDAISKAAESSERIAKLEKEETRVHRKKIVSICAACFSVSAVIICVLVFKTIENNKIADEVYNNFLGRTFSGKLEDDDGFVNAYLNNSLNDYKTYWKNTDEYSLKFIQDGTIYYKEVHDMTVLAYPKLIPEPEGYHNAYDGTYSSFRIEVTLFGDVYIKIGGSRYKVRISANNSPQTIEEYGYKNIILK